MVRPSVGPPVASPATGPAFELLDARRGWNHASSPFNLAVAVRLGGGRRRISASLALLIELYGHVRHERECHLVGGSGTAIELEEWGTDVRLRVNYTWTAQTSFDALADELESLLGETFEMHDRLDGGGAAARRERTLAELQRRVEDREVAFDVSGLYGRLAG